MTPEDKIAAAIDRNTEAVKKVKSEVGEVSVWLFLIWVVGICALGCPRAKAAPLISDGDEIASVGTVQEVRR